MYSHRILPNTNGILPTFVVGSSVPSTATLPSSITIDGETVAASVFYSANDATATTWAGSPETLTLTGSGANGTIDYAPTSDLAVIPLGKSYSSSVASTGNVDTEDFVVECVFKSPTDITSVTNVIWHGEGAGAAKGWRLITYSSRAHFELNGADGYALGIGPLISPDTWYHVIFFCDRSGSSAIYANGSNSGATNAAISGVGSLSSTQMMEIRFTDPRSVAVSHFAMWKKTSWLSSHVQAAISIERASRTFGIWPVKAGTLAPTVSTRSTVSSLDRYITSTERRIFQVGANWIRTVDRKDSNGISVPGLLIEKQSTNEYTYSQDFANAAWTKTRCSVSSNGAVAPDGTLTADGLIADANDNTHQFEQGLTPAAGDQIHSAWLKAGTQTFARLDITVDTDVYSYFDLATGVLGTAGPSARLLDRGIESWGNGWYRCWIRYSDVPGAHDHHIHACPADNDQTFAGNASTVDLWVWGAQHESDVGAPSSYIPTVAAAATRTKDQLQYSASGNVTAGTGAISAMVLMPAQDANAVGAVAAVSNAGSATKKFQVDILASDYAHCTSIVSAVQASIVGNIDCAAGAVRKIYSQWATNDIRLYVDSVSQGARDTSCAVAASMTVIDVGQDPAGNSAIGGVISDLRIYRKPLRG